jgi:hypothetical protein
VSEASLSWRSTLNISPSMSQGASSSTSPTRLLVTPRRVDLAVKWRLFRHLLWGNDHDAVRVYRFHIERRQASNAKLNLGMDGKSGTDHYIETAAALCASMALRGFVDVPEWRIPVDPNGELLGGAHRVACALALEIGEVPVVRMPQLVWAPPWGEQCFIDQGMAAEDLERLRQDWTALSSMS